MPCTLIGGVAVVMGGDTLMRDEGVMGYAQAYGNSGATPEYPACPICTICSVCSVYCSCHCLSSSSSLGILRVSSAKMNFILEPLQRGGVSQRECCVGSRHSSEKSLAWINQRGGCIDRNYLSLPCFQVRSSIECLNGMDLVVSSGAECMFQAWIKLPDIS